MSAPTQADAAPDLTQAAHTVRISEIYPSIQGESTHAGRPCVFVRLTGCPLRCVWCDTTYAFTGGQVRPIDEVVAEAASFGFDTVEVTGGEPLAQRTAAPLLARLADHFAIVLLETSGAISIEGLDPRVKVILDLKAPGSGEEHRNLWTNLAHVKSGDELKIVLADRTDYDWARRIIAERAPAADVPVLLSPVHGRLDPRVLARWIIEDRGWARMQVQLHAYIWGAGTRGV